MNIIDAGPATASPGTVLSSVLTALGPTGILTLLFFLLLFAGVVLPAVWSRHGWRRAAAHRTLGRLLTALERLIRQR
ncbi:hypothetical protein [Streptomyces sp. NPDC058398]|uniref:hypothetical protein n=1 Tax=Streptomyces sp. NPDC058398 TaxID=3346479 RepID=UPI003662B9D2